MNLKKWRSVTIPIEIYEIIAKRAEKNDRSVSKELSNIIKAVTSKENKEAA